MLEALFELIGELLLQLVGEALVEFGLHALTEPFRKEPQPWVAAIGYAAFGAVAGGLSLLVVPHHLTPGGVLRVVNVVLTPILAGLLMAALGAWRARRGDRVLRIDRFFYGWLFALALALVRFHFAN